MKAILDTACTRTVAGYEWFEEYCKVVDGLADQVVTRDSMDYFKFGASRVHRSEFCVAAWFATQSRWHRVNVAIVHCKVPLIFSRPVLTALGARYDMGRQKIDLENLGAYGLGVHPVLPVTEFPDQRPPIKGGLLTLWIPAECAYMTVRLAGVSKQEDPSGSCATCWWETGSAGATPSLLGGPAQIKTKTSGRDRTRARPGTRGTAQTFL